jgi:hypothetical protein
MNEYQFQHEQSPELQKQAVDAVNRTLWLEHWKLAPYKLYALVWAYIPLTIPDLFDYISKHWFAGARQATKELYLPGGIPLFVLMIPGGIAWLLVTIHLFSKSGRLQQMNKMFEPSNKTQWALLCLTVVPLLFFRFGTFDNMLTFCMLLTMLANLTVACLEFRKLRKSLIQWGVIDGSNADQKLTSFPIIKQLNEAEATVDQTLGVPAKKSAKSKLFVRANLI